MRLEQGDKVRYIGGTDIQVKYAGHGDPCGLLEIGHTYTLARVHVDRRYTDYWLEGINEDEYRGYNSVCFADDLTIRQLVVESYEVAKEHGFWDDYDNWLPSRKYVISTKLALIHSEVSEALEELREAGIQLAPESLIRYTESGKPEGLGPELADIVIRVADLAGALSIDLEAVIVEKTAYNRGRPFMHGKTV